jgi:polysaccharide biosynthesis/export protein
MITLLLLTTLQAAPAPAADTAQYIVGPADVLTISVFNQAQLSGSYTVEADGTISFPLLGRVPVGGLSVRGVEDEMRKRLAAGYVREPQVSVTVTQFRSQQVFIMGEVRQPGALQFTGSMTLLEALARAGSTTERAGPEVLVMRGGDSPSAPTAPASGSDPNAETVRVDLQSLQTGALAKNITLQAGDTIFVPRAETVFVSGLVRSAGEYVIRRGMTVRQVIALAGGITERGSSRRIQILRQVEGEEETINADMRTPVQAGDTIVVRERFF